MKKKILVHAALILSLLAGGCAVSRPAADVGQNMSAKFLLTSPVTISKAQVLRQDGKVLVSGFLDRSIRVPMPGHVDVIFLRPDGTLLAEKHIRVAGLNSKRRGKQEVPFRTSLNLELPEEASAILLYHAPKY